MDELRINFTPILIGEGIPLIQPRHRSIRLKLLSPDVAAYFPDEQSVNAALRTLIHVAKRPLRRAR